MAKSVEPTDRLAYDPLPPEDGQEPQSLARKLANWVDDHPVVSEAHNAILAFAGDEIDRAGVREILHHWEHFKDLTPKDLTALMRRFPGRDDT